MFICICREAFLFVCLFSFFFSFSSACFPEAFALSTSLFFFDVTPYPYAVSDILYFVVMCVLKELKLKRGCKHLCHIFLCECVSC